MMDNIIKHTSVKFEDQAILEDCEPGDVVDMGGIQLRVISNNTVVLVDELQHEQLIEMIEKLKEKE